VTDGVGAHGPGDLDLPLADQRPGDGGAQEVLPLVNRVGAEHREDVVGDEGLAQILDEHVLRPDAEQQRLVPRGPSSSPWPRSAVKVTTSAPYSVCSHFRMMEVSSPPE
jgi:hypothetical protein